MSKSIQSLNELTPEHRSYILVSSEGKYDELCRNKKLVRTLKNIGWGRKQLQGNNKKIITKNIVSGGFNEPVLPDNISSKEPNSRFMSLLSNTKKAASSTLLSVNTATQELKLAIKRRKEKKENEISNRITIPCTSPQEAQKHFTFGPGELNDGGLYVINPFNLDQYIPIASYYDYLAKEKVAAFLRISQTLGAKELKLMQASFTSGTKRTRSSLSSVGSRIGINVKYNENNRVEEQIIARYSKPQQLPYIPEELKEQVDASANLRTIALGRTEKDGNMESISYSLSIYESSSSFGKIVSKVNKYGLYVGGEYKTMQGTIWDFSIVFWPKSECGI